MPKGNVTYEQKDTCHEKNTKDPRHPVIGRHAGSHDPRRPLIDEVFASDTREDWTGINIAPLTSDYYAYTGGQTHEGFGASRLYAENDHVMFRGNAFTRADGVAHTVLFQPFNPTDLTNLELTRSVHYQAGGFPDTTHFTRIAIRFNDGSGDPWAIGDVELVSGTHPETQHPARISMKKP